MVEPGVVLDHAAVAQAAVVVGDEPGDRAFDRGAPAAVFGLCCTKTRFCCDLGLCLTVRLLVGLPEC